MSKRVVDIRIDEKEPQAPISQTKGQFMALIEAYKVQNPVKYAMKEKALLAKLEAMQ